MKKPFSLLKTAAHETAETIGMVLDLPFSVHGMRYEFVKFVFVIQQDGVPEEQAIKFKLEIPYDDLEQYFRDIP